MLKTLRGREHVVATGVALAPLAVGERSRDTGSGRPPDATTLVSATSATRVLMRDYSDAEIAAYVATGDPLDKAGAYSIQHPDFSPVAEISGCHLGVIGLPICIVARLLGRGKLPPMAPLGDHRSALRPPHPPLSRGERGPGGEVGPTLCVWSPGCTPPLPTEAAITEGGACEAFG